MHGNQALRLMNVVQNFMAEAAAGGAPAQPQAGGTAAEQGYNSYPLLARNLALRLACCLNNNYIYTVFSSLCKVFFLVFVTDKSILIFIHVKLSASHTEEN